MIEDTEFKMENTLNDEQALDCIMRILKIDLNMINNCSTRIRDEYIFKISKIRGISINQISRLLGIGSSNIYKIIDKMKKEEV